MRILVAACLALTLSAAVRSTSTEIAGVNGQTLRPFEPAGAANVMFFVATDCPISTRSLLNIAPDEYSTSEQERAHIHSRSKTGVSKSRPSISRKRR